MKAIARYGGWTLAPAVWAINTQLGQILPYGDCVSGGSRTVISAALATVVATLGAFLSLQARGATQSRVQIFVCRIGFLVGSACAFASGLQGAAGLLLDPCLH